MSISQILYCIILYPLVQIVELFYLVGFKVFKHSVCPSGFAVLVVSFAVSFMCLPLYIIAEKWQEKERQIQLKLKYRTDRIKKAFHGDEQYMMLSTYYRQNHYHPMMALRSSISLAIQIPFFIAAYKFLNGLEELKGVSFFFIKDLGSPDATFFIHNFAVNILPIAMTIINIVAGAIYSKGHPFKEKIQIYGMALIFLVLLYNSPSGLVIYWTMNNLFSLVKNIFYKMKHPVWVLYICLCIFALCADYFLLFKHNGFMYRRLMLMGAISIVFFMPLIVKVFNFLTEGPFKSITENKKERHSLFLLSGLILAVLAGLTIPSNVVSSSPMEFSFIDDYSSPFFFLGNSFFQAIGFFVFWPCCIYFLFGKKTQTIMAFFGSVICFAAIINAFVFTGNYGNLSSQFTFSNANALKPEKIISLFNFAILLLPLVISFFFILIRKTSVLKTLSIVLFLANSGIFLVNSITIQKGYKQAQLIRAKNESKKSASLQSIFHLSKTDNNVFVIMLDRAISGFVPYIFNENPHLYDEFDGFTFYNNTASYSQNTLVASPAMYGGYDYTPEEINKRSEESLKSKHNEAISVLPLLFSQNGFYTTVTDMSWANYSWFPDLTIYEQYPEIHTQPTIRCYTDEWLTLHPEAQTKGAQSNLIKRNFIWLSFLKILPMHFRDAVYQDGYWWSTNKSQGSLQDVVNNYAPLDFLPELTALDGNKPTFTYFVNELTHEPNFLQYPDYVPVSKVTDIGSGEFAGDPHYHANAASLLRLGEFFKYLKENNAYDNTRIIIVADHGANLNTNVCPLQSEKNFPFMIESDNPLLMIKDFNSSGKLKTDSSFMTNADTPALAINGLIENAVNPFTKNPIYQPEKKKKIYTAVANSWAPDGHNKNTFKIADNDWYSVSNNIFDINNWKQEKPY